ncbi:DUF2235 domain-containing protein [Chryseobacterium sp. MYb264]|uniref:T6SS phospholipase effector Tle1-like catalytic domain-containing protein n=1 Tax=Chryseobacterium sp. MYb264 TaxID=2745153 RepID=UPI002E0ED1B7|nr:DUF2235 domain-containing protein [Chryseobacterium sp. MYb264]
MKNSIISIGVFFDGTGNNGRNATSSEKLRQNNESYYAAVTNIYKLFELFNGHQKCYIEGIGTLDGAEDSDFAMATCLNPEGSTGYSSEDKRKKAFAFIDNTVTGEAQEYHFYVYGFSRGSMLARNLCYELLQKDFGCKSIIKIKFLGVFDTVESTPFNDYQVTVLPEVEKALHICAVHECRYFFPLTGFFDESKEKVDSLYRAGDSVHKEIFVPGVHADVGGGYLEAPHAVYITGNYTDEEALVKYIENISENSLDSKGNKIWAHPLKYYQTEKEMVFSEGYVVRDWVYSDLSKVYGKLMLTETNELQNVFNTTFDASNFELDPEKHSCLVTLSNEVEKYTRELSEALRPDYDYEKLADYTHFSANFGLYPRSLLRNKEGQMDAELINSGLNVPGNAQGELVNSMGATLRSGVDLMEDSVIDYAYAANIPNNDHWSRTILVKENFYNNKC